MNKKSLVIINYEFQTVMGECRGKVLDFLTEEQLKEFNSIGYSGKTTDNRPMGRVDYLNSLFPNEQFTLLKTRSDNGDFSEDWVLTRVILPEPKTVRHASRK